MEIPSNSRMLRRTFLQAVPFAAAALSAAPADEVPVKLGFDTYSLRAFRWKAAKLVDYAASLKLDTIQISSSGDYASLEPAHLAGIRERAASSGMVLDAGIGCICPTSASYAPSASQLKATE